MPSSSTLEPMKILFSRVSRRSRYFASRVARLLPSAAYAVHLRSSGSNRRSSLVAQ